MKVLFIGGTGNISLFCTQLALERGVELYLLNRGMRAEALPAGAKHLKADIKNPGEVAQAIGDLRFDSVVQFIAHTPADLQRDIALFRGKTEQYIFISSASAYQKPVLNYRITEDTPLVNPYWEYSRTKIAAEETLLRALREEAFPGVIVRPSLTYGDTLIPLIVNSWRKSYTIVDRMKRGKKIIVPGDGNSLWSITHSSDFAKGLVGLLGHGQTTGHSFHITTDEVLTWDQYYQTLGKVIGVEPDIIHIPTDFIVACCPVEEGSLRGDKGVSAVFDNSKIKRFVPGYQATMTFAEGMRRVLAWYQADPSRQIIDVELEQEWDKIIAAYEKGLQAAVEIFKL